MRSRIRTLLIILSVSLNVAFVAAWGMKTLTQTANAAKQNNTFCSQDSCGIWCPLHRALGTTEAQWQTLEPLQRKFQAASQSLNDTSDVLRAELVDLIAKPDMNRAAIEAKESEIGAIQQRMQGLVVNHLLEEKRILTGEQQAKLFAMMRDHGGCAGHGSMMGGGKANCKKNQVQNNQE
jgi:Spy/CpxP family protein refolding chaperone